VRWIYKGYGSIQKKLDIHVLPLKQAPTTANKGLDAIIDSMLLKMATFTLKPSIEVPWWKNPNVH